MFRGYLALNGVEISNSARAAAHLGASPPVSDAEVWGAPGDCELVLSQSDDGLFVLPSSSTEYVEGLCTLPDGSRLYDPGLVEVGDCWRAANLCTNCRPTVLFDDSWDGLRDFLGDTLYRPELAPWYTINAPQSGEFGGVWITEVSGFDSVPMSRTITELVGTGAVAGPHRDTSKPLKFTALLFGCSNAGLEYGLEWLDCQLRQTKDRTDSVLRYLSAHPKGSRASARGLLRELHGVVLTRSLTVETQSAPGNAPAATMCTVSWEMTALCPHSYRPAVVLPLAFDRVEYQPIQWVHGAGCDEPSTCDPMPTLFGEECVPETIDIVTTPPPTCGGCLPVCAIQTSIFVLDGPQPDPAPPGEDINYPSRCRTTAVSWSLVNNGPESLTAQTYWRACAADPDCDSSQLWPLQITGLPPGGILTVDGLRRRYWVTFTNRRGRDFRPVGMVSTPSGSPWEPAILDRSACWEFVVQASDGSDFEMTMHLFDRET